MNTREINRTVDAAYAALGVLNNVTWERYRDRCFDMACAEEREHRGGIGMRPASIRLPKGASVAAAGRLFVVKRIAEGLMHVMVPTIADVLHGQPSAIYAHSLVANYRKEISEAWKGQDVAKLAELDYVEFVNDGVRP